MFEAAIIAAAECRIDDLYLLFGDSELRKCWKLVLSSVPETLHIDKYKHIIPKPSSIKAGNSYESSNSLKNKENEFYDSVESIAQWSIERCFLIVKNTLTINEFALPFLTYMIKHLGFEVLNQNIILNDSQERHLICNFDSILLLYSFYSILEQYFIAFEKNTKFCKKTFDPIKFILNSPLNRFKMVIEQFKDYSYLELDYLFSNLFESYYGTTYLNSLYDRHLNKDISGSTKILICQPLAQKFDSSGYLQQFYYKNTKIDYKYEKNLRNLLLLNANVPLEETVINYLFDDGNQIKIDFFCKISKILVKNSKLTNNLTNRYITCPIRVIQFILLCINGKESPLLNSNAIDIQEYIDEIYECTPKSTILIKHIRKDLNIRKFISILKLENQNEPNEYICCPFCKNASVLYQGSKSIQNFRSWLNSIFFSIESIEKHQLFIDVCREFPIKFIKELTIYDIHKILYNPFNAECFLINLINKVLIFYTTDILNAVISIYKILVNSVKLPNFPFGSILGLIFYSIEKLLIINTSNIELIIEDFIKVINQSINLNNELEFMNLFLQLYNRVYSGYLERSLNNFTKFTDRLNKENIINNSGIICTQFRLIHKNIFASNIVNELIKYVPDETEINSIFGVNCKQVLEKIKYSNLYNNFEFKYYNPNSIILEINKRKVLADIFLANPTLALIGKQSTIWDKLKLIMELLFENEEIDIWNILTNLQISTLLIYGFYNFAINVLFNSISNNDCFNDEVIRISSYLILNSQNSNNLSHEDNFLLNEIEKIILSNSPVNLLSLFLNSKCTPIHDKTVKFDMKKTQNNIEKCIFNRYHFENLESNSTLLHLFFTKSFNDSNVKYLNLIKFNKYDLLICSYADLLFNNGYKSVLIINSTNIKQRTKILICISLISILSIKDLVPRNLSSIKSLILIISTISNYVKIIDKIRRIKSPKVNLSKLLKYENEVPIYLIDLNTHFSLKRWKLFLNILHFSDIAPLIHEIEEINSNNFNKKLEFFSNLEIYHLTKNLLNYEEKTPIITDHHIKAFLNYPSYSYKALIKLYTQSLEQESIHHIFIILYLFILKHLTNKITKINNITIMIDRNHLKEFIKVYKLFPKHKVSAIKQVLSEKKRFVDQFNFSKVWNNYWLILKIIKSINEEIVPLFSFKVLNYVFFTNKKFPIQTYRSLISTDGYCISKILNNLLENLSKNVDYTIQFIEYLPNDKQKLEIITLIKNNLINNNQNGDNKLTIYLNNLSLTIKIILCFPNICKRMNIGLQMLSYTQVLKFILQLFMDSDNVSINILISEILRPLKINFFELVIEATVLQLNEILQTKNESLKDLSNFIKEIFLKANSSIFYYGTTFSEFIHKMYNSVIKNMEKNYFSMIIFSMELASGNFFDCMLLNRFTYEVTMNINNLLAKMDIHTHYSKLNKLLSGISNLVLEESHSNKLTSALIIEILYLLIHYVLVLNNINTTLFKENTQKKSSNMEQLIGNIVLNKKIISKFTLNVLCFIITDDNFDKQQIFKCWYIFGEILMDNNDQKLFFEYNKSDLFIGLNSSFKKYILNSITYARIEQVLASKYHKSIFYDINELICSFNIILNLASHSFLGTQLFSKLIIPIILNTKKEKKISFDLYGKRICEKLNIKYFSTDELAITGIFVKLMLIYKKKIVNYLIPQLIALKSFKIVAEMIASENRILNYSHFSSKYTRKILSKLFHRFYYDNFNYIEAEIKNKVSKNNFFLNYFISAFNNGSFEAVRSNESFDIIYQKLLSKFQILFGEKQRFLEIKLEEGKIY